ncbi:SDR family NAD(P)-dependent oxidoreductase [Nonomuraea insulae]|uniref:SDR family NAD(P)-dependent oxidoreductase n=1 Tax=Nonomuraea insulae TaxID=1616787 RepID=A0ABW1CSB4_9ACTN
MSARVLVTGALGGLGSAIVDAFAGRGARIAVHHLGQPAQANERCLELIDRGVEAKAFEADVADERSVADLAAAVEEAFGGIDVLVNNAGVMDSAKVIDTDLQLWRRTMSVDLDGVFLCSKHVLPGMLRRGSGVIVNVSSQLAFKGARDYAAYCAAKAGVIGLTRAMARELGPAIRINAIAPGPVDTEFVAPWATEEWIRERTRDSVLGRLAQPHEIAGTVVFLASEDAALYHGQVLHLNGGGVMA